MQTFKLPVRILVCSLVVLFAFSCRSVKQAKKDLIYLNEGSVDTLPNYQIDYREIPIQKNDLLSIVVFSDNIAATQFYNQNETPATANLTEGAGLAGASSQTATKAAGAGYLVDNDGNIRFQSLGRVRVEGLTRLQLMDTLASKLSRYLLNPYVDVRFLNARITVVGEVQRPGVFSLPGERVNVLEVIGMAGDLTVYGRRDNILVIREQNGKREFGRLDIRQANIFQSPFFYLQKNDVVVIEPVSKKPTATEQDNYRKLTLVTSLAALVSTISILVTIFR